MTAAKKQRFLYPKFSRNFTAEEWGNSNIPKATA
jgi:hypothetical protein